LEGFGVGSRNKLFSGRAPPPQLMDERIRISVGEKAIR
jgi:hypothetical protein